MLSAINLKKLVTSLIPPFAAGFLGWLFTRSSMEIYGNLNTPPLSPPGAVFPVVWSILYALMGIALYLVRSTGGQTEIKKKGYFVFGIQLVFNFLWTVFFFKLGWYGFSAIWLGALIVLIAVNIVLFAQVNKNAGLLLIPYLLWCMFALYLNIGTALLN